MSLQTLSLWPEQIAESVMDEIIRAGIDLKTVQLEDFKSLMHAAIQRTRNVSCGSEIQATTCHD